MAGNNSDYNKQYTDLFKLLPGVIKSDTNKAVFNNLFNRFLTKQEVEKVAGYIGQGTPNAIIKRQIQEPTTHRQAFQLQPILYDKIGSVEHMASWKDIQNELTRLGIDVESFDQWGELLQFNWVPPINIDKLIHYEDYYWYDETAPNSSPQYITIRNQCSDAIANINFWQSLIDQFGSQINIVGVTSVDYQSPTFGVLDIIATTDTFIISGDLTPELDLGNYFSISNTLNNDGIYRVISTPTYNTISDRTTVVVEPSSVSTDETATGTLTINRFDKIQVQDNYTALFDPRFVFFVNNSSNTELNGSYIEVVSSSFNSTTGLTTITINKEVTNDIADGAISLEEQLNILLAIRDCKCSGSVGWDLFRWDDNPSTPLWGGTEPGDHATFIASISHTTTPSGIGSPGELWYDTVADTLYQYNSIEWVQIWNNFSLILNGTNGQALWDTSSGCKNITQISGAEQWARSNKWIHKTDVPNFSIAKKAQLPIIEYDSDLELNEWNYTNYKWKYRSDIFSPWVETETNPSLVELTNIAWWEYDAIADEIVFDERFGDLTGWFVAGSKFQAETITTDFIIERSTYASTANGLPYQTRIKMTTTFSGSGLLTGNLITGTPSATPIIPTTTSEGDQWKGYNIHWLFNGINDPVPAPHQTSNPFVDILPTDTVTIETFGSPSVAEYEYRTSYYAQEYTTLTSVDTYDLSDVIKVGTTRSLRRRALLGFNDVRVYVNNVRQYGVYDELEDDVINIVSVVATGSPLVYAWQVSVDVSVGTPPLISAGDVIRVEGNTGGGNGDYTVINVINDIIYVSTPIPGTTTNDGVISNVTTPMESIASATKYVRGIKFIAGHIPAVFDTVRIEVGEASINELGYFGLAVRTIEDDTLYTINGNENVSLVQFRKSEQIKTKPNQYPIFDIYNVDGTPRYEANAIFGFRTSSTADVNAATGLRLVFDATTRNYEFDQFLISEDNGILHAYRDFSNEKQTFWFDTETNELKMWTGTTWSDKIPTSNFYIPAHVGMTEPDAFYLEIDGMCWYDTLTNTLKRRNISTSSWNEVTNVNINANDTTLQTIWRRGLNYETYVPSKVDWSGRTDEEYNSEKDLFVTNRTNEILLQSTLSQSQAETQAIAEWNDQQSNVHSPTGVWVGDWEIPDPLYFNNSNENRKYVNTIELITHFNTIIESQPKIPGFTGTKSSMFRLLSDGSINYGLGGKIKQFDGGFDTFLSSIFVNNVTPVMLIEFAGNQYESLLNGIKEFFRKNTITYLTNTSQDSLIDFSQFVAKDVITQHEQNDNLSLIYGDSTTFNDISNLGIRNWIATLPYLQTLHAVQPERLIDSAIGLNEIIHHDGHHHEYEFVDAVKENIIRSTINTADPRTIFLDPNNPADTFGRISNNLPPNNISEFSSNFNTSINNRSGVFWYYSQGTTRILYRLNVVAVGTIQPSTSLADGVLWMDTTTGLETLRVKTTNTITGQSSWSPVPGISVGDGRLHNGTDPSDLTTATVSAWEEFDLNVILGDIIFEVENRLYENVPTPIELRYDVAETRTQNKVRYDQLLYEDFLTYVLQQEILSPLSNADFSLTDPFTWNYKYSTIGIGFHIVEADSASNSFVVAGNYLSVFDPCSASAPLYGSCPSIVTFYVKNSDSNDGTWTTFTSTVGSPTAEFDSLNNTTRVYVSSDVTDSVTGVIYIGQLPSSSNTGSESGGDWRDLYEKFYGTAYPHLEPWILQGYTGKPVWWDDEYLNDEQDKWGNRKWKYKHGFDIIAVDATNDVFGVEGDFREFFLPLTSFNVDNSTIQNSTYNISITNSIASVNVGTIGSSSIAISGNVTANFFNGIKFSVVSTGWDLVDLLTVKSRSYSSLFDTTTIVVEEAITSSTNYDAVGTIYNSLTNTTLIKVVEDIVASDIEGRIVLAYGMWRNIILGIIPAGQIYSNGIQSITGNPTIDVATYGIAAPSIPSYAYVSVNIDNIDVSSDGGTTVYGPDEIFPPYWNYEGQYSATPAIFDQSIRSLFKDFNVEIVAPGADFSFGDVGPIEWSWRHSLQFKYSQLTSAFKIDPINLIFNTFGVDFYTVGDLNIDRSKERTMCRCRTDFHGDIVGSTPYFVNGLNQWYVNFNRYTGFDASFSDFRSIWTQWQAPLMYQFSSFVETPSLGISHKSVDISENDYTVTSKKSVGVEDYWIDAFDVSILSMPPRIARYDNQADWKLRVDTNLPISRTIDVYDVHNYQFNVDPTTDICTLYTWAITNIDVVNRTFSVQGNQTSVFKNGRDFVVTESTSNNTTYTTSTSVYNAVTNETIISVTVTIASSIVDGKITAQYRTLPWETGVGVYLSTSETLPVPLLGDTTNGLTKYFIIVVDEVSFKLARTYDDAINGVAIDITSTGRRDHYVGAITSTFQALTGQKSKTIWRHYEVDTQNIITVNTPFEIQGMQNLINFIHGYDRIKRDDGWRINDESTVSDPSTNRLVNWQLELERFIDFAFSIQTSQYRVSNRYATTVDASSNIWMFDEQNTQFITGDRVTIFSSNGVYPSPFVRGITYYVIRDSLTEFRLAASKKDAESGVAIDVLDATGAGTIYLSVPKAALNYAPHQEINPMRNAVWFRPLRGIVSDIIAGSAEDLRTTQNIFDQYGRPLNVKNLRLVREDKRTTIQVIDNITNNVEIQVVQDPYKFIHLGGLHLFVDSFEHVLKINNYTSDNVLLYDPFVGLNVTKFEILFNRDPEFTGRPNVGGYYLGTFFNQGMDLKRNIEASIEDLRYLYDTNIVTENSPLTSQSRKVLGYEGTHNYLDNININDKSQFLFWKGLIQNKGSRNAINAFINSRRFIDANVDEFWALKIAEFGSADEKEYPEMFITTVDARSNDFRMQFTNESEAVDPTFTQISTVDADRWFNQPDQLQILRDNGQSFYFDMAVSNMMSITNDAIEPLNPTVGDGWLEIVGSPAINYFKIWDGEMWVENGSWTSSESPILRHNFAADLVSFTLKNHEEGAVEPISGSVATPVGSPVEYYLITLVEGGYLPGTGNIRVFKNNQQLLEAVDYEEVPATIGFLSNELRIIGQVLPTDEIEVVYTTCTLVRGTHYEVVNSNIVRLLYSSPMVRDLKLWGYRIHENAQNPARLIDKEAEVVLSDIQYWDPARGIHYTSAIHNIDLQSDADPAFYEFTPQAQSVPLDQLKIIPWENIQVGTTWLETHNLNYIPYYDTNAITNGEDRYRDWGQLSDWGSVDVYEWVKSDVHPSEYDAVASIEEGNASISEDVRKSGRIRRTVFQNSGPNLESSAIKVSGTQGDTTDVSASGSPLTSNIFKDTTATFITNKVTVGDFVRIASGINVGDWRIVSVDSENQVSVADDNGSFEFETGIQYEISSPLWVPRINEIEYHDPSISGTAIGANVYEFSTQLFGVGDVINVYVNGKLSQKSITISGSGSPVILNPIQVSCKEADYIQFVKLVPIDTAILEAGIADGTLLQEYEYSTSVEYDEFGILQTTYYFWVKDKSTLAQHKNRTMSNVDISRTIITVPVPYMFAEKPAFGTDVIIENNKVLSRTEFQTSTIGQTSIQVDLPIETDTTVSILVDGVPISQAEISFVGGSNVITLTSPLGGGNLLEIQYTGLYAEIAQVPTRFIQAIIRGLRGWIDADRRYTIRFVRDFTLKDTLGGKTPIELKNKHEEWELFRERQSNNINRVLWDRITEAMVGFKLINSSIRVPSYDRELYDEKYETDTRYGLGQDQAFTNGQMAIDTILADLQNSENSFLPVDINVFFSHYNFDTPDAIIEAMNTIYNTFPYEHVNRMAFSVLFDALSLKSKYPDIFKTSMISLNGIKPLQSAGILFDD